MITEPIINMYNRFRHCGLHIWVGSEYGLESRQTYVFWVLKSLKLTTIGTKSCLLLRLQTALKSDEGDLRNRARQTQNPLIDFQKNKATETVPDFSPRPTNPNGLLVSFLTKTSHIEIHDEAPVNVASLFFKILQTITGLPTFRLFALNPT